MSGKPMRFNTGWGMHSSPGNQGFGTVQINMMVRLCFGKSLKPQGCYDLDARELTEVGRFLIQAAVGYTAGVRSIAMTPVVTNLIFRMIWSCMLNS